MVIAVCLALLNSKFKSLIISLAFSVALANPSVSQAAYGDSAQILIPDVVQGMSDRTNKQCLVESLGNRECLGK